MTLVEANRWIRVVRALPAPRVRLLCLPYAGGGSTVFGAWNELPGEIEVCAVQLPGRQDRLREPGLTLLGTIAERLGAALALRPAAPLALYGHSFGALVAFELALRLQSEGATPLALVVGARIAPHVNPPGTPIRHLPQDAFLRAIHDRYGTSLEVLSNPDLMEIALPPLRADIAALETYAFVPGSKLDLPITALLGQLDRANEPSLVRAWQEVTRRPLKVCEVQAGHFFLDTHRRWVQERVIEAIDAARSSIRAAESPSNSAG